MAITRRGTSALAAVIAIVLAGGIATAIVRANDSGGSANAADRLALPLTSSPAPTPAPTSTPTLAPPNPELLTPPPQFRYVPDATAGTGAIDVQKAAALDGGGALSTVGFSRLGFQHGVTRQWQDGQHVLVDLVYTFATPAGADGYARTAIAARKTDPGFHVQTAPAGAPAGTAVFSSGTATARSTVAVFASGRRAVVIGLIGTNTPPDVSTLAGLARAQAAAAASAP